LGEEIPQTKSVGKLSFVLMASLFSFTHFSSSLSFSTLTQPLQADKIDVQKQEQNDEINIEF
jgi:hypothetical protein